jgi:hypothetical protein
LGFRERRFYQPGDEINEHASCSSRRIRADAKELTVITRNAGFHFVIGKMALDSQRDKQQTEDAETRRSEDENILAGEKSVFSPLISASPRLLFDFLLS